MVIHSKVNINHVEYTFIIEEADDMDAMHKSFVLTNPRKYCNVCTKIGEIKFDSNKDKEGNTYINIACKCGAKSKLGQYKTGGYFWREFEKWEGSK